ncbi:MAG: GNAT family N-acetyltransferase [Firmicutes bacterium]|nr:GNAT family N-acetyltransferase [Bacillota bacterium]
MIIRSATLSDAPGMARVHVDSWRTTYAGIVADEFLARLSYARSEEMFRRFLAPGSPEGAGQCTFVATARDGQPEVGQIVGFAHGGPARTEIPGYSGELYAIYILREFQRRGIGRRLVRAVAESLARSGRDSMYVWVLAANPSRRFYEALGGRLLRSQQIQIGAQSLEEVAYGWQDIQALIDAASRA